LTLKVAQADLEALSVAFAASTEHIATDMIAVISAEDDRNVYKTLAEAEENRFGIVLGPRKLSQEILDLEGKL